MCLSKCQVEVVGVEPEKTFGGRLMLAVGLVMEYSMSKTELL